MVVSQHGLVPVECSSIWVRLRVASCFQQCRLVLGLLLQALGCCLGFLKDRLYLDTSLADDVFGLVLCRGGQMLAVGNGPGGVSGLPWRELRQSTDRLYPGPGSPLGPLAGRDQHRDLAVLWPVAAQVAFPAEHAAARRDRL